MTVNTELQVLIVAIISYVVLLLPLIYSLARVWIQVKENQLQISQRPNADTVTRAIDQKIAQLPQNGGTGDNAGSGTAGTG